MKQRYTKQQILQQFKYVWKVTSIEDPSLSNDKFAKRQAWHIFCDGLHRDGYITDWQVTNWTNPFPA